MTRWTVLLTLLAVAVIVGLPLLYAEQRHRAFRNFRVVEDGQVYRSGQMSRAGLERVCKEKGIRTVVKLREPSDDKDDSLDAAEEAYCAAHGIKFVRLPTRDWEEENGKVPMEDNLRRFEDMLDSPEECPRPVLIHCFAGIHRTGAHVALFRMKYQGWTNAEAVDELKSCGKPTTTYVGNLIPFLLRYRPTRVFGHPDGGR